MQQEDIIDDDATEMLVDHLHRQFTGVNQVPAIEVAGLRDLMVHDAGDRLCQNRRPAADIRPHVRIANREHRQNKALAAASGSNISTEQDGLERYRVLGELRDVVRTKRADGIA